jgi:hypothetical protein
MSTMDPDEGAQPDEDRDTNDDDDREDEQPASSPDRPAWQ